MSDKKTSTIKRDYETCLNEARSIKENTVKVLENSNRNIGERLTEAVQILKEQEKKEKEAIKKQIKEDWIDTGICGRTLLIEALTKAYNPEKFEEAQIRREEQKEKKKILLAAGGEALTEESEDGNKVDLSKMSSAELREYYKNKQHQKTMQQASRAIQSNNKPTTIGKDNFDGEDDDESVESETEASNVGTKFLVIDNSQDIVELAKHLTGENTGKPLVIEIDMKTFTVVGFKNGTGKLKKDKKQDGQ